MTQPRVKRSSDRYGHLERQSQTYWARFAMWICSSSSTRRGRRTRELLHVSFLRSDAGRGDQYRRRLSAARRYLPVRSELHIHHLGGAIPRVPAGATAFTDRTSNFVLFSVTRTPGRAELSEHIEWARAARNALAIYGKGGMYVNFPGDAQQDDMDRISISDSRPPAGSQDSIRPRSMYFDSTSIFGRPLRKGELSEVQRNVRRCTACPRRI